MIRDVKITVLKVGFDEELCKRYGAPGITPCPVHTVGQVMLSKGAKRPPEMCGGAWTPCEKYVFGLAHGLDAFGYENWMGVPKTCVMVCSDGLRPVTFLLEVAD